MPAQKLGSRVHDHIRSELQRLLQIRRGKGVVNGRNNPFRRRHLRKFLNIHNFQERVGGGFNPDHARTGPKGLFDLLRVGQIDEAEFNAIGLKNRCKQPVATAVEIIGCNNVVTRAEHFHHGINRSNPTGKADRF